jgi:hypothetical protein
MRIGDESAYVEFTSNNQNDIPEICLSVDIAKDGFAGTVGHVWISQNAARLFVKQLKQLEKNEVDRAELLNLSSGSDSSPLMFEIRNVDSLGHLAIFVTVQKVDRLRETTSTLRLTVNFELDREYFHKAIADFENLLQ